MPRKLMILLNLAATLFCAWWFIAHAGKRVLDWEFWFAFGFLVLCATDLVYLIRTGRSRD